MNALQGLVLRDDAIERLAGLLFAVDTGARGIAWPTPDFFDRMPEDIKETFRGFAASGLALITEDSPTDG